MQGLRQHWTQSSIVPILKEESVWRNKRLRSRTVSFAADRVLAWSTITSGSLGAMILSKTTPTYLFTIVLRNDDIQELQQKDSQTQCDETHTGVDAGWSDLHCFLEPTSREDDVRTHMLIITKSPRSSAKIVTRFLSRQLQLESHLTIMAWSAQPSVPGLQHTSGWLADSFTWRGISLPLLLNVTFQSTFTESSHHQPTRPRYHFLPARQHRTPTAKPSKIPIPTVRNKPWKSSPATRDDRLFMENVTQASVSWMTLASACNRSVERNVIKLANGDKLWATPATGRGTGRRVSSTTSWLTSGCRWSDKRFLVHVGKLHIPPSRWTQSQTLLAERRIIPYPTKINWCIESYSYELGC